VPEFSTLLDSLLSPMLMFFVLGFVAAALRTDLHLPETLGKSLAIYLMAAIGVKGGAQLSAEGLGIQTLSAMVAAMLLSFLLPVLAYGLLRAFTRLKPVDSAAISAHYGSVSVVTFVTAAAFLTARGIPYEGVLVAVMALMETPAIVCGLLLARWKPGVPVKSLFSARVVKKVLLSGSIVLLLGSFVIGLMAGTEGTAPLMPFFEMPFKGILCLFLLEMGLVSGGQVGALRRIGLAPFLFGLYMPLVGAAVAFPVAALLGFGAGGAALLAVLCGSASYIVVPAAMRLALPEANPAYYVALSLAITFPFNMVIGIPLYTEMALWLGFPLS